MTEDPNVVLSALLDREPVDADMLEHLLETRAARTLLVDFVRLRALVHDDELASAAVRSTGTPSRLWPQRTVLGVAAAVVVFAAGLAGGAWWADRRDSEPPRPHRIVQFQPGAEWRPLPQE